MEEDITSLYDIAHAQAQHGHRCREKDLFQQWQWNHFCNQRHWGMKSPLLLINGKKTTLLFPAYKAVHLWCSSKRPINHMVNAISFYIFNISSFPAWTSAGGKNKNSQELTSWRCHKIDFTEGHRSSLCFFHLFPKQDIGPKQHMLETSEQTRNIRNG